MTSAARMNGTARFPSGVRRCPTQLAEFGLGLAGSVLAAAVCVDDRVAAELDHRLARARVPHVLLHRDQMLHVVLGDAAISAGLLTSHRGLRSAVGVSDVIRAADRMPEAAQEARWALGASQAENRGLVRYGDQTVLLLPRTTDEATVLVSRVLGPLIRQDAEHASDYLNTLRVILRVDRSWQQAAAALHIHKQTLGYRIRRSSRSPEEGSPRPSTSPNCGSRCARMTCSSATPPDAASKPVP